MREISPRSKEILGWVLFALSVPALLGILLWPRPGIEPPIIDVGVHYNQEAWGRYSTRAIVNTLEELGVKRVVVSSTPNEGTRLLMDEAPLAVIPLLVPYRERSDRETWHADTKILDYVEQEITRWDYRGIGEFHVSADQIDGPVLRRVVELAQAHDLVLFVHAEYGVLERIISIDPRVRVLWAHAGMTATPEIIDWLLEKHPNLWTELSHRTDVAPDGALDPRWHDLLVRHADRFMVGTGTYNNEFWYQFRYTLGAMRSWLAQLPPETARRIAYENANRLFASRTARD